MRNLLVLAVASATAFGACAQAGSVADHVSAQNALFEEFYQNMLRNAPTMATSVGDYRYNAQLGDFSSAHIAEEHREDDAFLSRLRAIPTTGMGDGDSLSHELLQRRLERADIDFELKNYEMPINQQNGIHTALADLPMGVPLDSVQHYEDYIARLNQIPRALEQTTATLRQGIRDGLMPPKIIVAKLPGQCQGIIAEDPFLLPLKKFPASFSEADRTRLTQEMQTAVNTRVLPAYTAFIKFLNDEYVPHGREKLSIESLPDGKRRYAEAVKAMTTVNITPQEVHELGLSEVKRITAEMDALAHKQGYKDLASFREAINNDRSGSRPASSRSSTTFASTSGRCGHACRRCSTFCPKGRRRWRRFLVLPRRSQRITSAERPTASGADASWWLSPTPPPER
jgi:uncharacterized protein (DUF885 family)